MDLNKVFVVGRVTQDIKMNTTTGGQPVANFSVATNRVWTDRAGQKQKKTEFHNVVAWGKLAEIASRYLTKGGLVLIEGRLETRNWEAPDGTKKYKTEIIAERLQLGPKSAKTGGPIEEASAKEEKIPEIQIDDDGPTDDINPDDVPF